MFKTLRRRLALPAALGVVWILLAPAPSTAQSVRPLGGSSLTLDVLDPGTGRSLTRIAAGHTVTLEEGQRVILRLESARLSAGSKALARPATRFAVLAGDARVRLERSTGGNSEAVLEALNTENPTDRAAMTLIGFEVIEARSENAALAGAIAVEVRKAPPLSVAELKIEVWDPFQQRAVAMLDPGQTLQIEPGQRLRVRVQALGANGVNRRVPPVKYRLLEGESQVLLGIVDRDEGWLTIEGRQPQRGAVARLEFVVEPGASMEFRSGVELRGELRIAVKDPHTNIGAPTDAKVLIQELYKGILMRRPEDGIVETRARDIAENGLEGLKRQAREIAESPESIHKFNPDGDVRDRLEALYLHLLGVEPKDIPTAEGRVYTALLQRTDIAEVVMRMIASDRFLFRHGFYVEP
jgi:hypothetical protein